ncbi:MAG: hypothetical protein V1755_13560 [Chloroflexota bacterium]
MSDRQTRFLGTYFDRDVMMRLSRILGVLSWVVAAIYAADLTLALTVMGVQYARGFMVGMAVTDLLQQLLYIIERPLHGILYFAVLQSLSHGLLIALDIEDNTRRERRD